MSPTSEIADEMNTLTDVTIKRCDLAIKLRQAHEELTPACQTAADTVLEGRV